MTRTPTNARHVSASDFFVKLKGKAKRIGEEEADKMANSMVYILRHRLNLGKGDGKFPRWDPTVTGRTRPTSKKSFNDWSVQRRANGERWIVNVPTLKGGYNYVNTLLTGRGWNKRITTNKNKMPRLVKQANGKIFSTQMPNGINGWLKRKREVYMANVKERFKEEKI